MTKPRTPRSPRVPRFQNVLSRTFGRRGPVLIVVGVAVAALAATMLTLRADTGTPVSLDALDVTYTQNFDTLANSGTSSTTPQGWGFAESSTNANTTFTAGTGSSNAGDTYSFGAAGSTDRAFGGLQSGALIPTIGAVFANNTGSVISRLDIAYTGEEWRFGTVNRGADRLDFQYSTNATSLTTGTWVDVDSLDFSTPNVSVAVGATNGNTAGFRTAISATLSGLNIAPGATFWIRWTDFNVSGADDGLAVDDFSLTPRLAASNPTGTGAANPNPVPAGTSTTLSATITPGQNPASTGLAVSCDLTAIGGSNSFGLPLDTGNVYSASYVVPVGTPAQTYSLPCTITDNESRSGSFNVSLAVPIALTCEAGIKTSTAIHTIQGSGAQSPLAVGTAVEVEGVVVANFRSTTQLKGFYLQEPDATWDADPTTSEGVFVFDNGTGTDVSVGDRVRLQGTVNEFSGTGSFLGSNRTSTLTEIDNVQNKTFCSAGNSFTRTSITLPTDGPDDLERYEGMAVSIDQRMVVTGNFSLGTFGQVDLAPSVLVTPTNVPDPSPTKTAWAAQASLNTRSVIALDDASTLSNANLFPTLFPQPGLSASNTLRVGDILNYDPTTNTNTPLVGVLDDRFGAYRIEPTAPVTFYSANPRPPIAPILANVGGRFRAVSANVLNFFTTILPPAQARGATTQTEFDHQKTKVIEALFAMSADVYGLSEVQNLTSGLTGSNSPPTNAALQSLVDGLNCKQIGDGPLCQNPPLQPFALVDTTPLGASNGTDAIRSAIIYRADRLVPIGGPALYYQNDTNRPTLAQTFQPFSGPKASQQTFTFVVNHFRSKGSACGAGQDDPLGFQGNCNGLRLNMAQNVIGWLATNPTGDPALANRRLLLVGDYNAYLGEDPIQWFETHGYPDLIPRIVGANAYSYDFGSQRGYLDHAIANGLMNTLVKSLAEWHNNSDEPSSLEALNSSNKSAAAQVAYFGADPWAASDHDPIVIGFNTLLGDLNDDGVVNATDQQIISAAMGRNAADVDRRIDYDGDGRISLNDYRIWTGYYRLFNQ